MWSWSKLKAIANSSRFYLWPAAISNTVVMSLLAGAEGISPLLFGLSLGCLASFGFLVNDLFDRSVDRLNLAGRLENADLSLIRATWFISFVFLALGLGLSLLAGSSSFSLALCIALGLILYNILLRRILLAATVLSALLGTSPLWAPLALWPNCKNMPVLLIILGVYLMFFAREIILDIKDVLGDRATGRHTFATIYGKRIAGTIASVASLAAGAVFLFAALEATYSASLIQASFFWLLFGVMALLGVVPGLRASFFFTGTIDHIAYYIRQSRLAMILLPFILCVIFLVN